ncbi:MAG: hypothetical protein ACHQT9_03865 [Candidatus Saccharimonadales bacterium]
MEGAHITSSNDPENIFNSDPPPKEKKKKSIFEFAVQKDTEDKQRHVAQEALKIEQSKEETEPTPEASEESVEQHMTEEERQYAAQVLRRESRVKRAELDTSESSTPETAAGELLVEEWDDRIEGGQDFNAAFEDLLSGHDIPEIEPVDMSEKLAEAPVPDPTAHEFPLHDEDTLTISHEQPVEAATDTEPAHYDEDIPAPEAVPIDPNKVESFTEPNVEEVADAYSPGPQPRPVQVAEPKPKVETKVKQPESPRTPTFNSLVGNFLGQRRGREKTEQKLLPVQRNLEKEVSDLQSELSSKEAIIRASAAEHIKTKGPEVLEPIRHQSVQERVAIAESMQKDPINNIESFTAAAESRMSGPGAHELHINGAGEHIGQVIVQAEQNIRERPSVEPRIRETVKLPENKRVDQLSRQELIEVSGDIEIEGTTLRKIYETHLIGEKALRRLVTEHMNGGNVARALQREIVEHEIDFERDPAMRDMDLSDSEGEEGEAAKTDTAPGRESLNQLLENASAHITEADDPLAHYSQQRNEPEKELPAVTQTTQKKRRKADVIMGSTILALVVAIVVLYLWRN